MTTVYVDFSVKNKPREIARDARHPFDAQDAVEQMACTYSRNGRLVRMFAVDQYIDPWRKRKNDPLYEAYDGSPTEDWR